jgi:hypothetical protein
VVNYAGWVTLRALRGRDGGTRLWRVQGLAEFIYFRNICFKLFNYCKIKI